MTLADKLTIRVVYQSQSALWERCLELSPQSTVEQALVSSGVLDYLRDQGALPQDLTQLAVGIFGQRCTLGQTLQDKDRVEIYRPLSFDPMESRRRRYAHKLSQKPERPRRKRQAVISTEQ